MLARLKIKTAASASVAVWPSDKAVVTAVVRPNNNGLPVLESCDFIPVRNRSEQAGVLKKIREEKHLEKYRCISLMRSEAYSLHMVEAPDVEEHELREAVRWRIKDMIDFPVEQAVIDVFDIPDQRNSSDMVYVVVAKNKDVGEQVKLLLNAGFKLASIGIMELAMRNISSLVPDNEKGVALVHLGRDSGSITLTKKGVLYFTRHLTGSEKLFGQDYSKNITAEMEGWLDTVIIDVQRSLDFYENQYQQAPTYSVVMVPLLKPIEGVTEYFSSQLGVPVRYLELDKMFEVSKQVDLEKISICLPAIGAAMRSAETLI